MDLTNRLSKSRYTKGLRCPLALYLSIHHYDLGEQPSPEAQARLDMGERIHEIARARYPGAVLIHEGYQDFPAALAHTRRAVAEGAGVLLEAAFVHDNVKIRVDALRRLEDGTWELIEVKSTKSYSPEKHLPDAGVQLHVLRGCGIEVSRVTLMHLNGEYVYSGGAHDPHALLAETDITAEAFDYLACVPENLAGFLAMLARPEPPAVPAAIDCARPYECEFAAWCHRDEAGPDLDAPVHYDAAVLRRLDDLPYPLHFVDFETLNPALPVFIGTRPYQVSCVQWSMHTLAADGALTHAEWLVERGCADPDAEFMRTLLDALPAEGTFVHYSPYERTRLVDIAHRRPEWRQPLVDRIPGLYRALSSKLISGGTGGDELQPRTDGGGLLDFDLGARVVKNGCLHPVFGANGTGWSIKDAIKVLARELPPYAELPIGSGELAMLSTVRMLDPATDPAEAARIRRELLAYCAHDTLAMVAVFQTLRRAVDER